ncbi:hypothetical protein GCM10010873_01510 [Cypionkella aquatica]|uniref:Flagellar protein FlgN n=2 Tax=Cypionkella aquatica TaxID=1756042 RepID=A0AA37TST0_9RHOB|nr:hypothetical protein GCM10010873_01510 [Cypionkella aquatica]
MQIEGLLDAIHAAILSADYTELARLSPELDAALGRLAQPSDSALILRLQRKAERNAICATAAAKGVRAAIRRLNEVRQSLNGLVTYGEDGQRVERGGQPEFSRRL